MNLPDTYPYTHDAVVAREGDLCVLRNHLGNLCGYCAFEADKIPQEWHGAYDVDALQYLAIHGGITYCEVAGGDEIARQNAAATARELKAPEGASLEERWSSRGKASHAAKLAVPYTHVIFGFDCGHADDEKNPLLQDPKHVLELTRQMRQQLEAYAAIIPQWRAANRRLRIQMIQEIYDGAKINVDWGLGARIGILGGGAEFGEQAVEH
jgi:hypothetical protein